MANYSVFEAMKGSAASESQALIKSNMEILLFFILLIVIGEIIIIKKFDFEMEVFEEFLLYNLLMLLVVAPITLIAIIMPPTVLLGLIKIIGVLAAFFGLKYLIYKIIKQKIKRIKR